MQPCTLMSEVNRNANVNVTPALSEDATAGELWHLIVHTGIHGNVPLSEVIKSSKQTHTNTTVTTQ